MGLFGFFNKKQSASADAEARVGQLLVQLDSPDPAQRLVACEGLRDLASHAEPAMDKLLELLNDPDGDVCNMASQAVTEIQAAQG